jgi:hypothetical protein
MAEPRQSSFDIEAIQQSLAAGDASSVPGWLEESWQAPEALFRALHAHVESNSPVSLKSRPGECQDFYHDLVVRHLGQKRQALVSHASGAGWRRLSYDELHARSTALAAAWEALGVQAGQSVALVLPVSEEYALALVTALRLGLVLSVLPPRGATFVRHRLDALAPEHVVSHTRYVSQLGAHAQRMLPLSAPAVSATEPALRSHTLTAADPVARLFSPLSATPEQPVEVLAGTLYQGLLRDAVLVLGLRPGDRLTLPGFEATQHQPSALLVTLLAGACFVEADERALADAETLEQLNPTVVGVTPALRDLILAGQVRPDLWRLWLRNPAEPYDWDRWEQLTVRLAVSRRVRGMNWVANAAFGGTLLFSIPQVKPAHFAVLPAPGQPWQLADMIGGGQPSHADSGLFAATGEGVDEATFGQFLVSRTRTGFFFAGSARLGAHGQTYPSGEVAEVAETHPEVTGASVVIAPGAQQLNRTTVTLVVFIDPSREPHEVVGVLRPELERLLDLEMGARYRPDTLCFYPLAPRRTEQGVVDPDWCRWQFLSGTLDRKGKDALFRMLGHLRRLLAPARTGA